MLDELATVGYIEIRDERAYPGDRLNENPALFIRSHRNLDINHSIFDRENFKYLYAI